MRSTGVMTATGLSMDQAARLSSGERITSIAVDISMTISQKTSIQKRKTKMQQSKNVEKQQRTRFSEANEMMQQREARKLQQERERQEARVAKQQLFAC